MRLLILFSKSARNSSLIHYNLITEIVIFSQLSASLKSSSQHHWQNTYLIMWVYIYHFLLYLFQHFVFILYFFFYSVHCFDCKFNKIPLYITLYFLCIICSKERKWYSRLLYTCKIIKLESIFNSIACKNVCYNLYKLYCSTKCLEYILSIQIQPCVACCMLHWTRKRSKLQNIFDQFI